MKKSILARMLTLAMLLGLFSACGAVRQSRPRRRLWDCLKMRHPRRLLYRNRQSLRQKSPPRRRSLRKRRFLEKVEVELPLVTEPAEISMFLLIPPFISAQLSRTNDLRC